jgi:hypothetical protein
VFLPAYCSREINQLIVIGLTGFSAAQHVGWVARSETHPPMRGKAIGFRKAQIGKIRE